MICMSHKSQVKLISFKRTFDCTLYFTRERETEREGGIERGREIHCINISDFHSPLIYKYSFMHVVLLKAK